MNLPPMPRMALLYHAMNLPPMPLKSAYEDTRHTRCWRSGTDGAYALLALGELAAAYLNLPWNT
eukprot:2399666-Rhodomonas_salina.1